ncbi:alkaline phosphatase family protein [Sporohalobacter salinus]|uniref:alkaline phosphatase family protein n=1 Tax=Sporohalobacter salinus TaxID=1494606 RepID=UPI00195F86F9|nr:alkaline phosphatase family protein [Sporohalobacter salinus]MBM7622866.1 phosphopentomutase [Sporohalobacter salinus]
MQTVVTIFIDGLGLGGDEFDTNPLVAAKTPGINSILGGNNLIKQVGEYESELTALIPTDSLLGVDGLPQSATGQTAILTGVNASEIVGRHVSGFPGKKLNQIIKEESIFKKITNIGLTPYFINTYTDEYFNSSDKHHYSTTTLATMAANLEFNYIDDLLAERSIYHDLTQQILVKRGFNVPLITPQQAAQRLGKAVNNYDFILFEYFLTDMIGHKQDLGEAIEVIENLDQFLSTLVNELDLTETLLAIVSDHGNIENISIKSHTYNPVPTILIGAGKDMIKDSITDLTDLTPALVKLLADPM